MIRLLCSFVLSLALCAPAIAAESNILRDYWQLKLARAEVALKTGDVPEKINEAARLQIQSLDSLGRSQEALQLLDARLKLPALGAEDKMLLQITRAIVLASLDRLPEARKTIDSARKLHAALRFDSPFDGIESYDSLAHADASIAMRERNFLKASQSISGIFAYMNEQIGGKNGSSEMQQLMIGEDGYHLVMQQAMLLKARSALGAQFEVQRKQADTVARKYLKDEIYLSLLDMYAGKLSDAQITAIEAQCQKGKTGSEALNCQAEVSYFAGVWYLESGNKAAAKTWFKHGLDLEPYGTSEWAWLKQEYAALQ